MKKSLRTQLLFSHLLMVGLMLAVMLVAVAGFFRLGKSVDRILKDNYKSVVAAQDMKESLERMDSAATFALAGQIEKAQRQYEVYQPRFEAAYSIEADNITESGERAVADDLKRRYDAYHAYLERLLYAKPALTQETARDLYFETLEPSFVALKKRTQDILDLNQAAIVRADARARAEAERMTLLSIGLTATALVLGLGVAWRNIAALMTPLGALTRYAEQVGRGNLSERITTQRDDEIGQLAQSFNQMAAKLDEARRTDAIRLHRAERMSDSALDNLYDPVIVTDGAGRVLHFNRAAEGLFGPGVQARGKSVRSLISETQLVQAIEQAVQASAVPVPESEAGQIRVAGRVYRIRATPMIDDDGIRLGAVAALEDVTHLTELDRLKTEFIGVASHELRTPVTSLSLSVQLLLEGAVGTLTPDQKEVVLAQQEDLKRLERMMRDLLDLTRLEAGANPPRFEVVSPEELTTQAMQAVEAQAQAKGVTLTVSADANAPEVRADRGQIGRVLVNLLNNAIRHTPDGGLVALRATPESDGKVRFSVADTGVGIPAEYLPRLFERFVQVPGATRGGAGLGLSISQIIVKAHGGTMEVQSEPGRGSTFQFTLPTTESK